MNPAPFGEKPCRILESLVPETFPSKNKLVILQIDELVSVQVKNVPTVAGRWRWAL